MQAFAGRWNIKIDFLNAVESATEETTDQMHIDLRQKVSDYLSITPDKEQATQFLDIINSLVSVDQNISVEEQFILDEIRGMIDIYINDGQVKTAYGVIVVPQNREERAAIRALLPDVTPKAEWGGNIYYVGVYNSRPYADMISEKYQALNLFSTVKMLRN
jgi:hypothetical protein